VPSCRLRPSATSAEPSSTRTRPSNHSHDKGAPLNASVEVAAGGEGVVAGAGGVEMVLTGVVGAELPPVPVDVAVGLVTGGVATT
jgi:hypothetical protein